MKFGFSTPSVTGGYGHSQPLASQLGGYKVEDTINSIMETVNKATRRGSEKTGKISGIANFLRLASMFTGPLAPIFNLAIGTGETLFTDKALSDMEKSVKEQSQKGFLSSQLPSYVEDIGAGRQSKLTGNILKTLGSTGLSAYQQGGFFPKTSGMQGVMQQGANFGKLGRESITGQQSPPSPLEMIFGKGQQSSSSPLEMILQEYTQPKSSTSTYSSLGL